MQKFKDYQPTKGTLVGTAIGAAVLTMVVGFNWGGWVLGGTAQSMAEEASQDAREQIVATICVDKFVSAIGAAERLVELKETSSYQQDNFVEDGGWSTIDALVEQVSGAADICADRLVDMESLPESAVETTAEDDTAG